MLRSLILFLFQLLHPSHYFPTPPSPTPWYLSQPECNFFRLELTCFSDFGQQQKVLRPLDMYICWLGYCEIPHTHLLTRCLLLYVCMYVCVCVLYLVLFVLWTTQDPKTRLNHNHNLRLEHLHSDWLQSRSWNTSLDRIASPRFAIVIVNSSNSCLSSCCCCFLLFILLSRRNKSSKLSFNLLVFFCCWCCWGLKREVQARAQREK